MFKKIIALAAALILTFSAVPVIENNFGVNILSSKVSADEVDDILFDWEYYVNSYSDLAAAFGNDPGALYSHYLTYGKREGRRPSDLFDATFYLNAYSDLKAAFGNDYTAAYDHFVNCGIKEGRQASEQFNVLVYKSNYYDLRNAFGISNDNNYKYLQHWRTCGRSEGRNATSFIEGAIDVNSCNPAPSGISDATLNEYVSIWNNKGCSYLRKNLYPNASEKAAVLVVQKMLNYLGYNLTEDGIYGNASYNAVKDYQKSVGLYADGLAGKDTFNKLLSQIRANTGTSSSASSTAGLNWNAAYNYAKTYWNQRNPAYSYYTNNNCANFVNQCLVAAGLSTNGEYCNGSYAFINVKGLRNYFQNNYGINYIIRPRSSDIQAGDVVYTNNGGHVMICMDTYNGKILCSGNTNNRDCLNVSIGSISGVLKTSVLFG